MNQKLIASLAVAGLLAVGSGAAWAAGASESQEATALQGAKVSLSQAIATAEQHTGGTAFDAGVDIKNHRTRIAVETNGPKGVRTTLIDPQTGRITGGHAGPE
jgi:uncharacterized membrane protein YkoI